MTDVRLYKIEHRTKTKFRRRAVSAPCVDDLKSSIRRVAAKSTTLEFLNFIQRGATVTWET